MASIEEIKNLFDTFETKLMGKIEVTLETKIAKITEDALQKAHNRIATNAASIMEINNEITPIKNQMVNNTQAINEIGDEQSDMKERLNAMEKANTLNEMRLKSVEEELQEKAYQMSFNDKR